MNKSGIYAFSLAEILLTLTVIGVVTAISIPTLLQNINDAQYKTAYKKAYADASQAFMSAKNLGFIENRPGKYDQPTATQNFTAFKNMFNVSLECFDGDNSKCWDQTGEKLLLERPNIDSIAFIDNSGRSWALYCSVEAIIVVDTNGLKKPNIFGKDRFIFVMSNNDRSVVWTERQVGNLLKLDTAGDFPSVYNDWCRSGSCYYTSWLRD